MTGANERMREKAEKIWEDANYEYYDSYEDGGGNPVGIIIQALLEARDEALEEAAILVESNDECVLLKTGKRFLETKSSNNVDGTAYAEGIRSLKSKGAGK